MFFRKVFRTFEDHVFNEMRQAKFILVLIPCTGVHGETAVRDRGINREMYHAKSIRQCMSDIIPGTILSSPRNMP